MTQGMKTIVFPVKDLARAKALYGALLGVAPSVDQPYYAGFDLGGQHVGLNPHGHDQGATGPIGYWHVDDAAAMVATLVAAGATVQQAPKDVGGGRLVATVADADGNTIGVLQDR